MKKIISKAYTFLFWLVKSKKLKLELGSYQINRKVKFEGKNKIRIGVSFGTDVTIGKYTYISGPNSIINSAKIGRFCSIALGVKIGLDEHDYRKVSTHPFLYSNKHGGFVSGGGSIQKKAPPVIGNDVWIGVNSIISRGVSIGDGAVIGAGSIVTRDVPPYAIVAGVPAKILNYRFDENTIDNLMNIEWFNWSDAEIEKNIKNFSDITTFIKNETKCLT